MLAARGARAGPCARARLSTRTCSHSQVQELLAARARDDAHARPREREAAVPGCWRIWAGVDGRGRVSATHTQRERRRPPHHLATSERKNTHLRPADARASAPRARPRRPRTRRTPTARAARPPCRPTAGPPSAAGGGRRRRRRASESAHTSSSSVCCQARARALVAATTVNVSLSRARAPLSRRSRARACGTSQRTTRIRKESRPPVVECVFVSCF